MKRVLTILLLLIAVSSVAQQYNNEWIDYKKTYYKFKVGKAGLYRINQPALAAAILSSTPAEQFQLWRNGKQVAIYTSVASGVFSVSDYIEFWGEGNDGKADKDVYRKPTYQINNQLSLLSDTAAYFLTVNTNTAQNLRITDAVNNVAGNVLPVEPYFMHTLRFNYRDRMNRGYALNVGEDVYSSSYDEGEFLSTVDINLSTGAYKTALGNLFLYPTGPSATVNTGLAGNSSRTRAIKLEINNSLILQDTVIAYTAAVHSKNGIALSILNGVSDTFKTSIVTSDVYDRVVTSFVEIQYPRQFNFGGASNFSFALAPSGSGYFLQISNFDWGNTVSPVLYDITNNQRYIANTGTASVLSFALPASAAARTMVLCSEALPNINVVPTLQQRSFLNYATASNQADYIIVSNKTLYTGANYVEQYRQYRASVAGGNFNAKIYDIDDLVDQFAFGIKQHPLSIRNFVRFATAGFTVYPKYIFMIGKAVTYDEYRLNENTVNANRLDVVPTFGWPASDALLVSNGPDVAPLIPFGRLSAVFPEEVNDYLTKIKEYELQATSTVQTIANKAWMKQLVHVAGADDPNLNDQLAAYLLGYENIIKGPLFGGTVANFNKRTGTAVSPITTGYMSTLFEKGIALLTYFGHSAASSLAYNLNDPNDFNNGGKYPVFLVNGCTAGNFFDYDTNRYVSKTSLAEKFILAKQRGAIGFIASTHFGLTSYLDLYTSGFYTSLAGAGYGESIGKNMMGGFTNLKNTATFGDYFGRTHAEQFLLHGDPAVKIYTSAKPDFVLEDPQVTVNPALVSVADLKFSIKAYIYNLGKVAGDSVTLSVKRTYPDGTVKNMVTQRLASIKFIDSFQVSIPIVASTDKGNNSITLTIDSDNQYDELSELNNTVTKTFTIFEDELKPIYPCNYCIVNKPSIKLAASTANPIMVSKQYAMEMDTTELFNSAFKITKTIGAVGGVIEFDPAISLTDSMVYYWRVAPVPNSGSYFWNTSSFIYLQHATTGGYNQSHFYQHTKDLFSTTLLDSASRAFQFPFINQKLTIHNRVWRGDVDNVDADFSIATNDAINTPIKGICYRPSNITFTVFNPSTLETMFNVDQLQPTGQYGSLGYPAGCTIGRQWDFAFNTDNNTSRNDAKNFMDNNIPNGSYVVVRSISLEPLGVTFAPIWKTDQNIYGVGNTLYDHLKNVGFADVDSFNRLRAFIFVYKKNDNSFTPVWNFTVDKDDKIVFDVPIKTKSNKGFWTSPVFGPAKQWKNLLWNGNKTNVEDNTVVKLMGIKSNGQVDTLFTYNDVQLNNDISTVSTATYPYLQLMLYTKDTAQLTPFQLKYWRLLADMVPEGAIAPDLYNTVKDTLEVGEPLQVAIAFKNVSDVVYQDSIKVKLQITDNNNVVQTYPVSKLKKLQPGDTAIIRTTIPTQSLVGTNNLYINVNPDFDQPEQYLFNNFLYKKIFVKADVKNPIVDVTFDGVHILNNDIVSAKPFIRIKLKDESKYLALNDTNGLSLQLRLPNGNIKKYSYGTDTLKFTPANLSTNDNSAYIDFTPTLSDSTYELIVTGKDRSNNTAGTQQYRVLFNVVNKPMISNLFNYPNPFTSSTAFVFTLTGSRLPQNMRIQILTVTGKIVKEITQAELGNIHIGRNITDYKWDGRDMFGQALGNGVYLYRLITSLDGHSLDKLDVNDETHTDKYFKSGYGKMYLMR